MDRQLTNLYVSVFIASLGLGLYMYFIPVFAQSFGATFLDLGLIGSAAAIAYSITPVLVAYLADRFNRAWLYTSGLALNVVAVLALITSGSVRDIIFLRLLGGVGLGFFWPAAEVLVTDLTPANRRVMEMGRYSVVWSSGLLIGPVIGGLIIEGLGFVDVFLVSAAIIGTALLPSVFWLHRGYSRKTEISPEYVGSLKIARTLVPWYLLSLCYGLVFSIISAIFPGYANTLGITPATIGLLFTAFGIARIVTFATVERYVSFGETKVLIFVSVLVAISNLVIVFVPNVSGFLVALVLFGGCFGILFPLTISLVSRHFPANRLGAAVGSYETMFGVGFVIGPSLAGAIAMSTSVSTSFLVSAIFGGLMAVFTVAGAVSDKRRRP